MSQRDLRPRKPVVLSLLQGPVLGLAHPVHRVVKVFGDVELVKDDLRRGVIHVGERRLDVGLPHVHGDRRDPLLLGRGEGRPEPVQALLLAVLREIQDAAPLQIRDHSEGAVPLRDGLLIHPKARDDLVAPAGQAPGHRAGLDPPRFVPGDAEEVGATLDGALAQEVDGEPLKDGRELAARLGPGDGELLHPVGRALDPRDLGLDPGGELAGVEVPPAARLLVISRHRGVARWAGERAVPRVHPDRHVLALHV